MNVAYNLERSALYFPDRPAVSESGIDTTYLILNKRANQIAGGLIRLGTKPGDLIGLCATNSADWLAFYFGVLKAGAVAVTLSAALSGDELELLLTHAKPRILFTAGDKLGRAESLRQAAGIEKIVCPEGDMSLTALMDLGSSDFKAVERDRADAAAVLYTGGTTGLPKGVLLTHENIVVTSHNVAYSERSTQTDRALCFLPLNHVFGQIHITNATVFSSGCIELMPAYDMDRVLSLTACGKVTKLYAVPTIYTRLLGIEGLREKLAGVRYCFSAAASMPEEIVRRWKEHTGLTIYEGYGMTESASAVTYNHYYDHVIGSVGTPVPGVEVEIRDAEGNCVADGCEGEICVRGRNIMKGYLHNPDGTRQAFLEGEWFRSGDVGVVDPRGYLFIVDRLKDMIITGGENVYPKEVEELLFKRSEVQECAVIGLPDLEWGERVAAVVVPQPGRETNPDELKVYLKEHLAAYKVPKQYIIVDELPKSSTGKILKREIRKKFADQPLG
ncbi:MAG: AMP-binding protein [Pseudomonadota bacterium]